MYNLSFYIHTPNAFNILSCHFINSMRTQIYGVQLIHRENNALGSLQLPHTRQGLKNCFLFFHSIYIYTPNAFNILSCLVKSQLYQL